jgi:hypothetical protein
LHLGTDELLYALSFVASLSFLTSDIDAVVIDLYASSMEAVETCRTFNSHAFSYRGIYELFIIGLSKANIDQGK